ncbi:MAG: hypothetical protein AAGB00_10355 [Planctomycetota bacterium]
MHETSMLTLAVVGLLAAAAPGAAQSQNDIYTLRQELKNDSYLWEPMVKKSLPAATPRPVLINPAGRANRGVTRAPLTPAAESVLRFYGRRPAAPARPVAPRRFVSQATFEQPASSESAADNDGRPFRGASSRPTVSAYLELYREEFDEASPNYYAFVRPRLQQEQRSRQQQLELQRLRRRGGAPRQLGGGQQPTGPRESRAAAAGNASRYGDTGQFYSNWTR